MRHLPRAVSDALENVKSRASPSTIISTASPNSEAEPPGTRIASTNRPMPK
jgi:hypothetical protein